MYFNDRLLAYYAKGTGFDSQHDTKVYIISNSLYAFVYIHIQLDS